MARAQETSLDVEELRAELHRLARSLTGPALRQLIRLLRSDKFEELTQEHIRHVGEYRSIELGGESFFDRAFTSGKEAAGSLGFATLLGRDLVLEDLTRLGATLGCRRLGEAESR